MRCVLDELGIVPGEVLGVVVEIQQVAIPALPHSHGVPLLHFVTSPCSCLMEAASTCPVVPEPVQRYIDEVCESLRHIADCEGEPILERLLLTNSSGGSRGAAAAGELASGGQRGSDAAAIPIPFKTPSISLE